MLEGGEGGRGEELRYIRYMLMYSRGKYTATSRRAYLSCDLTDSR